MKETGKQILPSIQPFDLWRSRISELEEQITRREEKVAGVTLWCRVRMGGGERILACSSPDVRLQATKVQVRGWTGPEV